MSSCRSLVFLLVGVIFTLTSVTANADTHPDCIHTASDYDGDGYGWENNQSCKITEASIGPPTFNNLETNTPVQLTRPYWNAYRDFQNRTIQCDLYAHITNEGYLPDNEGRAFFYSNDFTQWSGSRITTEHSPLQADAPWYGAARSYAMSGDGVFSRVSYKDPYTYWTVNDGIYYSNAGSMQDGRVSILSEARYVELIDEHNGAVRIWWYQDRYGGNRYAECFDVSGDSFQPTGYMGEPRPAAQPVSTPLLAQAAFPESNAGIVNLDSSLPAQTIPIQWDITKLYQQTIECIAMRWLDDSEWTPHSVNNGYGYSSALSAFHVYHSPIKHISFYAPNYQSAGTTEQGSGVYAFYEAYGGGGGDDQWLVENGLISEGPLSRYRFAEIISSPQGATTETRFWIDSESYDVCTNLPEGAILHTTDETDIEENESDASAVDVSNTDNDAIDDESTTSMTITVDNQTTAGQSAGGSGKLNGLFLFALTGIWFAAARLRLRQHGKRNQPPVDQIT